MSKQIAVRIPNGLAESLEDLVARGRFETKADAIRTALEALVDEERRGRIAELIAEPVCPTGSAGPAKSVRFVFRRPDGTELTPVGITRRRRDVVSEYDESWRHLTHRSWHSDEARAIRPLWAGERVDMTAIVCALFGHKLMVEKQVA